MRRKKLSNARRKALTSKSPETKSPETVLVEKLLPESKVRQIAAKISSFSGPLPHPDIFKQYADVITDAPERILRVFEDDSKHSRDISIKALEAQVRDNRRAHWMAYSLVVFAFVLCFGLAWLGKDLLAGTVMGTTLVAIVIGFLKSRNHSKTS
ncbi:MAG: hypothetical protein CTY18_08490 [Methylomonas sp.]|uniref:DUF2335 domain-containing protein n=1 Tax=Flavobacterium sp. TaxID=239 RepID=UPI000D2AA968|nr:DUF2335 domain-containing protein [Flavobacterium sp.]MBA4155806.1 hypothetical protein [Flavobacterium sp.]PPD17697.1 MAG: hypothetical protein CTY24_14435 [Methylobacter sp.]PPD34422.1 MAG: hypothetical protein CTY18_08490 [Methylomonas sp.]